MGVQTKVSVVLKRKYPLKKVVNDPKKGAQGRAFYLGDPNAFVYKRYISRRSYYRKIKCIKHGTFENQNLIYLIHQTEMTYF